MINPCLLAQQSHVIIAGANESAKCQPVGIGGGIKPVIGFLHTCEIGKQTVSSTTFHDIKFVVCAIDGGTSPSLHLLLKSRPILLIETPYLWRDITVVEGLLIGLLLYTRSSLAQRCPLSYPSLLCMDSVTSTLLSILGSS